MFTDRLSWRWCFIINLPLCAVSILGVAVLCPERPNVNTQTFREKLKELDYLGPFIFLTGAICLLLALIWGDGRYRWNSPVVIGLFCGFVIVMPVWAYSQYRLGEKATIPPRLFLQRTVFFSSIYSFLYVGFQVALYYLPLYFQAVKDTSAQTSSIYTFPIIVPVIVTAGVGGVLMSLVGYYGPFMIGGCVIASVGLGLMSTFGVNTPVGAWVGYQVLAGIGIGFVLQIRIHVTNLLICRHQSLQYKAL